MTPRERTLAVLARQRPDRLPRELKLTPPLAEVFRRADRRERPGRVLSARSPRRVLRPADGVRRLPPLLSGRHAAALESARLGSRRVGCGSNQRLDAPLHPHRASAETAGKVRKTWSDTRFPICTRPQRHAHLEAEVRGLHDRGLFVIGFMEWTIFEIAWHMRGMAELFEDIAFNPPLAEYLLDRITESRCHQARRFAEAGVDLLKIGDDVGTQIAMMISPRMYREWFKPRHAAVIAAAREVRPDLPVCYHSDGNCWDVIPDLIEVGVTVLNPIQPECLDVAEVKREVRRPAGFLGRRRHADHDAVLLARRGLPHRSSRRSTCSARRAIFPAPRTCWNRKCPGRTSRLICVPWKNTDWYDEVTVHDKPAITFY